MNAVYNINDPQLASDVLGLEWAIPESKCTTLMDGSFFNFENTWNSEHKLKNKQTNTDIQFN